MKSTLDFLYSLQKFGMKKGLRNIRRLLRVVGNPHTSLRTIHIAGTNGKGSTSSMIAAILTAAGYKVGLYTSPHLVKFNERIRINGKMISDSKIVYYTQLLTKEIQNSNATFFESTTAIAFKYFFDENVDFAVIETGLGGRLDSTNIIHPLVSVITTIGKDHTEILGKTFAAIASEKAGIIKSSVPVVVGNIKGIALKTILQRAKLKKSPVLISTKVKLPPKYKIELYGDHQQTNAKAAIGAITILSQRYLIGDSAIKEGLQKTNKLTGLRGRFELVQSPKPILLDVAHNPEGIKTIASEIKKLGYKNNIIIFAAMKEKDYRSSLAYLRPLNPVIIATQPKGERALSAEMIFKTSKTLKMRCILTKNVKEAVGKGIQTIGMDGLLVITGSHFLVGEAIPLLHSK